MQEEVRVLNRYELPVLVQARAGYQAVDVRMELQALGPGMQDGHKAVGPGAQPFIGGDAPNYADYIVFGPFQWARVVSPFRLLAEEDPIYAWRERLLDAFDGMARKSPGYAV